jgi:hypothetical protein
MDRSFLRSVLIDLVVDNNISIVFLFWEKTCITRLTFDLSLNLLLFFTDHWLLFDWSRSRVVK